ncbi:MAG: gamma carbonic anhydrase family protein [Fusobacteriaceae bacterium]
MIYKLGDKIPKIGENNFIADNARVIGDVITGKDVSIWYSAVLRADCSNISIGDGSNIQDNVTLHGDVPFPVQIGKGVTVGHNSVVHGCTIGDNCIIGMGAILLNGAKIPNNCIVGAGALVTEKLEAEEGSLIVGSPARVVRKLSEENIKYISYAKNLYVKDIEIYKNLELIRD